MEGGGMKKSFSSSFPQEIEQQWEKQDSNWIWKHPDSTGYCSTAISRWCCHSACTKLKNPLNLILVDMEKICILNLWSKEKMRMDVKYEWARGILGVDIHNDL